MTINRARCSSVIMSWYNFLFLLLLYRHTATGESNTASKIYILDLDLHTVNFNRGLSGVQHQCGMSWRGSSVHMLCDW